MSNSTERGLSRRDMMKKTGAVAAVSALAGVTVPLVHAGESNTIQVALIGCGGRGTGAAINALSNKAAPTKLIAMADVFPERLAFSYKQIQQNFGTKSDSTSKSEGHEDNKPATKPDAATAGKAAGPADVPEDHKFIGFDGYRKAMDLLRPGDVVILATPPAFRWVHFTYAIQKGLNVFMEKPIAVDGPSARKMFKLGQEAEAKNLKVGVGLMCRHCAARHELVTRLRDGQIGDIVLLRAYRQAGPTASAFSLPKPEGISELLYQIQRFHSFLWASGGAFSDFLIHNIDECCWMKDAWPVKAQASGGRHYRGNYIDQNFDTYAVEYTYPDGAKLLLEGRTMDGCHQEFASYAHGTKGSAIISKSGHTPANCRTFKGQNFTKDAMTWHFPPPEPDPYQLEWEDLIAAIRDNKAYNEVKRGAEASLVTAMGRMAAHTGQIITYDQMLHCEHEFAPDVDKLTMTSAAPLQAEPNGKYPIPQPGIKRNREF